MYVAAHNATDRDLPINEGGSVIPAGQWGVAVPTNADVVAAVAAGDLHLYPYGAEGADGPEQATALARSLNETEATVLVDPE